MKQVIYKIVSLLKRFFLRLRIHLSVGICSEEDSKQDNETEE